MSTNRAPRVILEPAGQMSNRLKTALLSATLPAMPNIFPFNELLLGKGKMRLSAKTREWKWNYAGPVLLYTSKCRIAREVANAHKLNPADFTLGAIAGIGWLLPVRLNSIPEMTKIELEFGNGKPMPHSNWRAGHWRYEFGDLKGFGHPVSFKPPRGAVRTFRVPVSAVADALKKIGLDPAKLALEAAVSKLR